MNDDTQASVSNRPGAADLVYVRKLSKTFARVAVLDSLDFELRAGEIVGLVGPNGAGKTTTLKLLLGVLRPSSGYARICGFDATHDSQRVKELVGFTPDEPQFYEFLSGRETLDFAISVRGLDHAATWARLRGEVELLDFAGPLDALIASYSHGMKKKLALLCARVHRPAVLLLDEPTNGLDPSVARRVCDLLQRHAESGGAVLVSTHLLEMAERLCDRVLVLDRGRMLAMGTVGELRARASVALDASLEQTFVRLVAR